MKKLLACLALLIGLTSPLFADDDEGKLRRQQDEQREQLEKMRRQQEDQRRQIEERQRRIKQLRRNKLPGRGTWQGLERGL